MAKKKTVKKKVKTKKSKHICKEFTASQNVNLNIIVDIDGQFVRNAKIQDGDAEEPELYDSVCVDCGKLHPRGHHVSCKKCGLSKGFLGKD